MRIEWQVENNEYCREVLKKHWPKVPCHYDIRSIDWEYIPRVDLICGGFPCQPFSTASRGRRTATSLWPEMLKAISIIKPTWVIGENVVGAASLVLESVAIDLENIGYEVAPLFEIPACAVGCDHRRSRYWILGYTNSNGQSISTVNAEMAELPRIRQRHGRAGNKDGIPNRVDRLRGLGNAIVPQIAEAIGKMILEIDARAGWVPLSGILPD